MILVSDMQGIARERLRDAEALSTAGRLDGCFYLCGYCVEIALKARICRTLDWAGFPATTGEFQSYKSFQTHDLDVLLHLSGIGTLNAQDAADMLTAVRELIAVL